MSSWIHGLSYPLWLYLTVVACSAAQLGAFLRAFREWKLRPWLSATATKPPSLWPTVFLLCFGFGVPAASLALIEPGRRAIVSANVFLASSPPVVLNPDPWERYHLLSYLPAWAIPSALVAALAVTFALSSRWKTSTARRPVEPAPSIEATDQLLGPRTIEVALLIFPFFACALLPFLIGLWVFNHHVQNATVQAALLPPGEGQNTLLSGYLAAIHAMNTGALLGAIGLLLGCTIAVILLRRWQKQGMAWPQESGRLRRAVLGCSLVLFLAGIVVWSATPFRVENRTPWPKAAKGGSIRVWPPVPMELINRHSLASLRQVQGRFSNQLQPFAGPLLAGTQEGVRTTVLVQILSDHFIVGGTQVGVADLRDELQTEMRNHAFLNPGVGDLDRIIVLAAPNITGRRLVEGLLVAQELGCREVDLLSYRLETTARPILGLLSRADFTTTPAALQRTEEERKAEENETRISPLDFVRFEELLAAVIAEARSGKRVTLVLPKARIGYQPTHE